MTPANRVTHEFVELLPDTLIQGVVYVSVEHCTVVHLCCSGCGERVVNGLSPAGWQLIYDGETISLHPSIGNGTLACNSHYWIRRNKVLWAEPLTAAQTRRAQRADRASAVAHHSEEATTATPIRRMIGRLRMFRRSGKRD